MGAPSSRRKSLRRRVLSSSTISLWSGVVSLLFGLVVLASLVAGCAGQTSAPSPLPASTGRNATMYRISDIHFDPFFGCAQDGATCRELFDQLFDSARGTWRPGADWGAIFENFCAAHPGYDQCAFHLANSDRDTNFFVFHQALESAAAVRPKPRFVIYTGDFLAHEFRDRYDQHSGRSSASDEALFDAFVDQTILFVASEMRAALGVEIYAALGNNDAYCGDYRILPGSGFLEASAHTWDRYFAPFQAGQRANFENGGYYRVDLQPAHRALVLNTVIYTGNAQGRNSYFTIRCDLPDADQRGFDAETFDVTKPPWAGLAGETLRAKLRSAKTARGHAWIDTQFGWLVDEILDANEAGEMAWIAAHVPPGLDGHASGPKTFFTAEANAHFAALLSDPRFAPTIAGFLAAHTHENEYKLSRTSYRDPVGGIVLIAPAIDSDHGNQPAYQVHEYDPQSLAILDYTTYSTLDGTSWSASTDFRDFYTRAIRGYEAGGSCDPSASAEEPAGVNRDSLGALFDALQANCDASRDKYDCSYVSLPYEEGGCGKLPRWCGDEEGQAYQVSVADLLGTFPRACRP